MHAVLCLGPPWRQNQAAPHVSWCRFVLNCSYFSLGLCVVFAGDGLVSTSMGRAQCGGTHWGVLAVSAE